MKKQPLHEFLSIRILLSSLLVFLICLPAQAQKTKCDLTKVRTVDSISYLSVSEGNDEIAISISRQYGLRQSHLFDFIIFTVDISVPISEKDSLGLLKYSYSELAITLDDHSIIKIDTGSSRRLNEYLKPPGYQDIEYRSGGLNLWPPLTAQTESFRTILNPTELKQLLHRKMKYILYQDRRIPVPERISNTLLQQLDCIAKQKPYVPKPKGR